MVIGILTYHYKPEQFDKITEKFKNLGTNLKEYLQNETIDVIESQLTCVSDEDCNTNNTNCQNRCICLKNTCYKNISNSN